MSDSKEHLPRRVVKEAVSHTIWEAAKLLVGLVFTASTFLLLSNVLVSVWSVLAAYQTLIAVILVSGGILGFGFLWQRFSQFRPWYRRQDFEFVVVEKEIVYEYRDRTHLTYRKRLQLRALKHGLDRYEDKYHWTGHGYSVMKSTIQEQEVRPTVRKNVWQCYEIRFQKTLSKGEEIETEVIWDLEDSDCTAVPFFSATINEPTKLLNMKLSMPPSLGVREATGEVCSSIATSKATTSRILQFDRNGTLVWEIKTPRLFHHYEIKWVFPNTAHT